MKKSEDDQRITGDQITLLSSVYLCQDVMLYSHCMNVVNSESMNDIHIWLCTLVLLNLLRGKQIPSKLVSDYVQSPLLLLSFSILLCCESSTL